MRAGRDKYRVSMILNGADNPLHCPFPLENLHMVPRAHSTQRPKWHLDRFSRFRRTHECDQQTHRQTDHATLCVAIGRYLQLTLLWLEFFWPFNPKMKRFREVIIKHLCVKFGDPILATSVFEITLRKKQIENGGKTRPHDCRQRG